MPETEAYGDFGLDAPGQEIDADLLLNNPSSYGAAVFEEQICLRQTRLAGLSRHDVVAPLEAEIQDLVAATPEQ